MKSELREYFEGSRKTFGVQLEAPGTAFQVSAWNALNEIPYGTTSTYEQQAVRLGNVKACRAVARANGANGISIVIPCHRIIGNDGSLTGYGGGVERKRWLIDFEKGSVN